MIVMLISPKYPELTAWIAELSRISTKRSNTKFLKTVHTNKVSPALTKEEEDSNIKNVENLMIQGHHTLFEFVNLTFLIEDVSRALLAQITRHRLASFNVESQRYVNYDKKSEFWQKFIMPDLSYINDASIRSKAEDEFKKDIEESKERYHKLISCGVHNEDARLVLGSNAPTTFAINMNLREFFFNFFPLRSSHHAQEEIQQLANAMYKEFYLTYYTFTGRNVKLFDVYMQKWLKKQREFRPEFANLEEKVSE